MIDEGCVGGSFMGVEIVGNDRDSHGSVVNRDVPDIRVIVKVADGELRRLIRERAEIAKRIGTIRQTIAGLCNLFGDDELTEDLRQLVNGKVGVRRRGITQACRKVLMDAACPLTARNVCEQIQRQTDLPSSKNLVGSVTTVLSRLEQYGEVRTVPRDRGPRAWVWVSVVEDGSSHSVDSAVDSEV
jgi:hypothetical protein